MRRFAGDQLILLSLLFSSTRRLNQNSRLQNRRTTISPIS